MSYIRVRIWKMGIIESYQRGLSVRNRWHWMCRRCIRTDGLGCHSFAEAYEDAQDHVDEHDD